MLEPNVLFENKDFIIINKPAGLLVHGVFDKHGPKHSESTLIDWLLKKYPETREVGDPSPEEMIRQQRGGIVHRLDRETSGVMIIARNQKSFEYLKKLFQDKKVQKTYLALVWGRVKDKAGTINKPISIKDGSVKRTVFKGKMTREAITDYKVKKYLTDGKNEFTLLEVMPKTGRTHQIRVHLSSIGHPVVGDKLYGKKNIENRKLNIDRHFLHAQKIQFAFGKRQHLIEAPLPPELRSVISGLTS